MSQEAKEISCIPVCQDASDMIRGFGRKFEEILEREAGFMADRRNPKNPEVTIEDAQHVFKCISEGANRSILGQCRINFCKNPAIENDDRCIGDQNRKR